MAAIKLSARLEAIAKLAPSFGGVADVGTDHGYIPVWLAQSGHNGKLFATDINNAPLEHAKQTAIENGQDGKISFHLCDGLAALNESDVATVIIAGMGGENIAEILAAVPWTKGNNCFLILQPMSKSAHLRKWLLENGYKVLSEQLVDDGTIYEILTAEAGVDAPYSPAELQIGHQQLISSSPLFEIRLNNLIEKSDRAVSGLTASSKSENPARLSDAKDTLFSLLELKSNSLPSST